MVHERRAKNIEILVLSYDSIPGFSRTRQVVHRACAVLALADLLS